MKKTYIIWAMAVILIGTFLNHHFNPPTRVESRPVIMEDRSKEIAAMQWLDAYYKKEIARIEYKQDVKALKLAAERNR